MPRTRSNTKKAVGDLEVKGFHPPNKDLCIFCNKEAGSEHPILHGWMPGDDVEVDEPKYIMHIPCLKEVLRKSKSVSMSNQSGGLLHLDMCLCEHACDGNCDGQKKPVKVHDPQAQPAPPPSAQPPKVEEMKAEDFVAIFVLALIIVIFMFASAFR